MSFLEELNEKYFKNNDYDGTTYHLDPEFGELFPKDGESYFRTCSFKKYNKSGPIVLCFGGNMSMTADSISRECLIAENYLQLLTKNNRTASGKPVRDCISIVGFAYGVESEEDIYGTLTPKTIRDITKKFMISRCVDASDKLLPVDEIKRNLAQLVFFTYCKGATEVNRIADVFRENMYSRGLSEAEVNDLLSVMTQVTYAPERGSPSEIPTVRFDSMQDRTMGNYRRMLGDISNTSNNEPDIACRHFDGGEFYRWKDSIIAESVSVISKKLLNAYNLITDEHPLGFVRLDKDWEIHARNAYGTSDKGQKGETFKKSPNAEAVAEMISWSLSRAVEDALKNSLSTHYEPRTPLTQIYSELESVRDGFPPESLGDISRGM